MKIEHIALYTVNLERMCDFYQTYFGGVSGQPYHNPKTGLRTRFLSFEQGARLELMTRPEVQEAQPTAFCTGWAHLAFAVGTREKVDALTERLRADGYSVTSGPRITGDGYYESCVLDPDGNMIEITAS